MKVPMKKKSSKDLKMPLHKSLIAGLHEDLGQEFATSLGHNDHKIDLSGVISTRCPTVDLAIGRGGVPLGRLTIVHGGEGSGKTTLALMLAAEVQAMGGACVYFDKEYKLDPDYAAKLGVDIDRLVISQPDTLEQVIQGIKATIKHTMTIRKKTGKRRPILIILDSLNATQSLESMKAVEGKKRYPAEAMIWSQNFPEIIKLCKKADVAIVMISQIRKKLNIMFGDDNGIAGGNAPPFYASLIMFVRNMGSEREGAGRDKVANKISVECKKNQIAPPFKKGRFTLRYGKGVDYEDALLMACEECKVVRRKGGSYRFGKELIGKSREKAVKYMRTSEGLVPDMEKAFRKQWEETESEVESEQPAA
jgi:recombination protein RecA